MRRPVMRVADIRGLQCGSAAWVVIEYRWADGQMDRLPVLAISVPRGETAVLQYFQERMPYGLFVPDVQSRLPPDDG
jgi:hypothetical protein